MVTVVAALIHKDDKVLIAKRACGIEGVINRWEFPGGKVEVNEKETDAIEREIKEELNIKVKAEEYLTHASFDYPTRTINVKLFNTKYVSGNIQLVDHYAYNWVTYDELLSYDLLEIDRKLATWIVDNQDKI